MNIILNISNHLNIDTSLDTDSSDGVDLNNNNNTQSENFDILKVNSLFHKISYHLKIDNFAGCIVDTKDIFNIIAETNENRLILPPLYFVKREDIPFTGPDDPLLKNQQKIQEFADALCAKFQLPKKKVASLDVLFLKVVLEALRRPEDCINGLSFTILHEFGHIKERHQEKTKLENEKLSQPTFMVVNFLSLGILKPVTKLNQTRTFEKEADLFACHHGSKEMVEGGVYLFKTIDNYLSETITEKIMHLSFRLYTSFTHTSFADRIEVMNSFIQ